MFLNILTPKEKVAFIALAEKIILSDEEIANSETVLLKAMRKEMELMDELIDNEISEDDIENMPDDIPTICAAFTSKKSKISVIMELIALGFVDGKLLPQEREVIYEIALHFDIKREEVDSYIEWAGRLYH